MVKVLESVSIVKTSEDSPPVDVPPPNNHIMLGNVGWDAAHYLGEGLWVCREGRREGGRLPGSLDLLGGWNIGMCLPMRGNPYMLLIPWFAL